MYKSVFIYILILFPVFVFCQETNQQLPQPDTIVADTVVYDPSPFLETEGDTLLIGKPVDRDTFRTGDQQADTLAAAPAAPVIEAPIDYNAEDSIIVSFDGQRVFLYNNAKVTYQQIELTAYHIILNLETKEVYAEGMIDTAGVLVQKPVFKDGDEEFESKTLRYNFETEKGIITEVVTEQGEGFVHSERTKKISPDAFILRDGKYTTCDAEHPHFYLHLSKAKVISNEKIITGPAYMVLEDVPIYFPFLPFGYFPNTPTYSSGILIPAYGEENNRGFFLRDGGYYWAANEYFDLAVQGDIYSKGSWGTRLGTNYRLRYRFSGSFNFNYAVNVYGERGLDTYQRSPQFAVLWSHSQDPKANPNRTFSASVNFSTSGYDRQNSYSVERYLSTQKSSSISYSRKFENTPFNMSVNLRHSQNSLDSTLTLSMPEMTFNVAKFYPLRKKTRSGPIKWYEKLGMNYTANLRNTVTAKESEILHQSFTRDWKNGIRHNIPITLPGFNLFSYVNVTPSFSYNEKWYFKKLNFTYRPDQEFNNLGPFADHVEVDTITGLNRVYDYAYSLSATTNIYGMYLPRNANSKVKGIRHKMTPSVSFSYRPDFGDPRFGYWQPVQVDSTGRIQYYDINYGGIYGGSPSMGAAGSISFSLNNNLEMKVLDTKDTTATDAEQKFRKVKIIDNLSMSSSYNLVADSFALAPVSLRARTSIKGVSINMSGVMDPYILNENYVRVSKYAWSERSGLAKLGRLTRANVSFGMNFQSQKGQKQAARNKELVNEEKVLPGEYEDYIDFNIPWNFSFDYSFNYTGPTRSKPKGNITQALGFRGSMDLTDKWRLSANTNFDIMAREFAFTTFNVDRDLHCWQMSFNFVPFGFRKYYSFTIVAKSTLLKDLKLEKRKSHFDNF